MSSEYACAHRGTISDPVPSKINTVRHTTTASQGERQSVAERLFRLVCVRGQQTPGAKSLCDGGGLRPAHTHWEVCQCSTVCHRIRLLQGVAVNRIIMSALRTSDAGHTKTAAETLMRWELLRILAGARDHSQSNEPTTGSSQLPGLGGLSISGPLSPATIEKVDAALHALVASEDLKSHFPEPSAATEKKSTTGLRSLVLPQMKYLDANRSALGGDLDPDMPPVEFSSLRRTASAPSTRRPYRKSANAILPASRLSQRSTDSEPSVVGPNRRDQLSEDSESKRMLSDPHGDPVLAPRSSAGQPISREMWTQDGQLTAMPQHAVPSVPTAAQHQGRTPPTKPAVSSGYGDEMLQPVPFQSPFRRSTAADGAHASGRPPGAKQDSIAPRPIPGATPRSQAVRPMQLAPDHANLQALRPRKPDQVASTGSWRAAAHNTPSADRASPGPQPARADVRSDPRPGGEMTSRAAFPRATESSVAAGNRPALVNPNIPTGLGIPQQAANAQQQSAMPLNAPPLAPLPRQGPIARQANAPPALQSPANTKPSPMQQRATRPNTATPPQRQPQGILRQEVLPPPGPLAALSQPSPSATPQVRPTGVGLSHTGDNVHQPSDMTAHPSPTSRSGIPLAHAQVVAPSEGMSAQESVMNSRIIPQGVKTSTQSRGPANGVPMASIPQRSSAAVAPLRSLMSIGNVSPLTRRPADLSTAPLRATQRDQASHDALQYQSHPSRPVASPQRVLQQGSPVGQGSGLPAKTAMTVTPSSVAMSPAAQRTPNQVSPTPAAMSQAAQSMVPALRPPTQEMPTVPSVGATKPNSARNTNTIVPASASSRPVSSAVGSSLAQAQQLPPRIERASVLAKDKNAKRRSSEQATFALPSRLPADSGKSGVQSEATDTTSTLPSVDDMEGSVGKMASLGLELVEGDFTADEMSQLLLSGQLPRDIGSQQNSVSAMQRKSGTPVHRLCEPG